MMWRQLSDLLLRVRAGWWTLVYRGYRSRYEIDPAFRFNGTGIQLYGDGRISLLSESYIGGLSTLQAGPGLSVSIGHRCSISHNVRVYTTTSVADADFRSGPPPDFSGSVVIEDGVWIGVNVYIGPGVTIGANAVVGANSVVTKSIPPSEIWGGVPARLIRQKRGHT